MMIRPATRFQLAAIDALERTVFVDETYPAFFFRQAHELWPEWLLVAEEKSVVLGYALAAPANENDVAWLLSMAVADKARGRGLGADLLRALTGTLQAAGISQVQLTVHPDNPARRLYEKAGFCSVADEPDYFHPGDPRLVMALALENSG